MGRFRHKSCLGPEKITVRETGQDFFFKIEKWGLGIFDFGCGLEDVYGRQGLFS